MLNEGPAEDACSGAFVPEQSGLHEMAVFELGVSPLRVEDANMVLRKNPHVAGQQPAGVHQAPFEGGLIGNGFRPGQHDMDGVKLSGLPSHDLHLIGNDAAQVGGLPFRPVPGESDCGDHQHPYNTFYPAVHSDKVQIRYFLSMWRSRALVIITLSIAVTATWIGVTWNRDYRSVTERVDELTRRHVPDTREDIATVRIRPGILTILIDGETSNRSLYRAIQDSVPTRWLRTDIRLGFLPDTTVDGKERGVVKVAVGNLRREPRHGSELVDQAIMGTPLAVLKHRRGWYQVKTSWNYIGWMTGSSISFDAYPEVPDVRVRANLAAIRATPNSDSELLHQAPFGTHFRSTGISGLYRRIQLYDGTTGFVLSRDIEAVPVPSAEPDGSRLVATAKTFLGLPYLWGGNASTGFDCSGFTQTVFREQGIILPRDANMQIRSGEPVDTTGGFSALLPGDLLYFGPNPDRITHVALSLGGARMIHASDYVQVNSLNPADSDFAPDRLRTLQAVRRIQ